MRELSFVESADVSAALKAEEFFAGVGVLGAGLLAIAFAPEALAGAALYSAYAGAALTGASAGGLIGDSLN
ncbi:MAG: hypothetical protein ACYC0F_02965 [Rhodanobacter sp.]